MIPIGDVNLTWVIVGILIGTILVGSVFLALFFKPLREVLAIAVVIKGIRSGLEEFHDALSSLASGIRTVVSASARIAGLVRKVKKRRRK